MNTLEDSLDFETTQLALSLLEKVRRLKLKRAIERQCEAARDLSKASSAIYDEKGKLRGEMKLVVDPFLANSIRIKRHAENEYLRKHGISPFADPDFIPYLKRTNPVFDLKFRPKEGTVFIPDNTIGKKKQNAPNAV